jgi:hypothetical protein
MDLGNSTWDELQEGDLEQARTTALQLFLALDTPSKDSPEELVEYARGQLRELLQALRFKGEADRQDESGRLAKNLLDKWGG